MSKKTNLIFLGLIFIFGLILYSYRYQYLQPFDYQYSKDLFDHSQWRIPQSKRGIGDDSLYQVAGYELWQKANFFEINPEMPPLGKALYGLSIVLFKNAFYANILIFVLSLWIFKKIAQEFFKKQWQITTAIFFLLLQPVFFTQLNTTLLDLPQLLSLLIHVYGIVKLLKTNKKQWFYSLIAGISLGAFISIKIGFLVTIILLVDFIALIRKQKILNFLLILLLTGIIYLLVYLPYFLQGNSLISFIQAQLWIIHFHTSSKIDINHLLLPISFFTGWYKGWSEDAAWSRSEHWSYSWPIIGLSYLLLIITNLKKGKIWQITIEKYFIFLTSGVLIIYLFIPFWTRYLLLVLPFMILLFVAKLPSKKSFWAILVWLLLIIQLPLTLISNPKQSTEYMAQLWQKDLYLDLYSYINFPNTSVSRKQFEKQMLVLNNKLSVIDKTVEIELIDDSLLKNKIKTKVQIVYKTPHDSISHSATTYLVRKSNRWFLDWGNNIIKFSNPND